MYTVILALRRVDFQAVGKHDGGGSSDVPSRPATWTVRSQHLELIGQRSHSILSLSIYSQHFLVIFGTKKQALLQKPSLITVAPNPGHSSSSFCLLLKPIFPLHFDRDDAQTIVEAHPDPLTSRHGEIIGEIDLAPTERLAWCLQIITKPRSSAPSDLNTFCQPYLSESLATPAFAIHSSPTATTATLSASVGLQTSSECENGWDSSS